MDIAINASPLILLSKIDRLVLLNILFSKIYVPLAVLREIQDIDTTELKVDFSVISYVPLDVSNRVAVEGLLGKLHMGEVEVIIGALENGLKTVVLDESAARNKAKKMGLEVTGTLGILLKSKKLGVIEDIGSEITNLRKAGMYLSDELVTQVLELAD